MTIILLGLLNFIQYLNSDPCFQPVGITNGLVPERLKIKESRLSGKCQKLYIVQGDFGISMTIKGIAVRSTIEIAKEFSIAYAYRPADPWMFVEKSSRDKPHKDRVCDYFFIIYLWCMSQLKFTDTNLQYSTVLSKLYTLLLVYIFAGTIIII